MNDCKRVLLAATLPAMLAVPLTAGATVAGDTPNGKAEQGASQESENAKPMNPDEPMPTQMARPGMKEGDVKASAEKKQRELEEMMREKMK